MEEKDGGRVILWYRLRGLGLICLCFAVFFVGAYAVDQRSMSAGSRAVVAEGPVCAVDTRRQAVSLTFEVAGDPEAVGRVQETLDACGVRATFFVTGEWAEQYPDCIRMLAASGHEIGCLGKKREDMTELSAASIRSSILGAQKTVRTQAGVEATLFRPPYGRYDEQLLREARRCGCQTVLWSVDSLDWKDYGADAMVRTVTESGSLQKGAVLRFHTDAADTAAGLEAVIGRLQEQGYELATVSELAG